MTIFVLVGKTVIVIAAVVALVLAVVLVLVLVVLIPIVLAVVITCDVGIQVGSVAPDRLYYICDSVGSEAVQVQRHGDVVRSSRTAQRSVHSSHRSQFANRPARLPGHHCSTYVITLSVIDEILHCFLLMVLSVVCM